MPYSFQNDFLRLRELVFAGAAAGLAIHQPVGAEAHVQLRLAENAILLTPAARFGLLALGAHDSAYGRFRRHAPSVEGLVERPK